MSASDFTKLEEKEKSAQRGGALSGKKEGVKRKKLPGQRKNWLRMD
jgi:hypothetical protein